MTNRITYICIQNQMNIENAQDTIAFFTREKETHFRQNFAYVHAESTLCCYTWKTSKTLDVNRVFT